MPTTTDTATATTDPRSRPRVRARDRRSNRPPPRRPRPLGASHVRIGTASWTDPTMTAAGVFYPSDADTAEERLAVLRVAASRVVEVDATYYALPSRRTVRAVGGADAARLHVRHQGPRPDDRPADRDEAAAEGPPRGAAGRARRKSADLRQGPARRAARRGLGAVRRRPRAARARPASSARSCSSTRAGSSPPRRTATTIEEAVERLGDGLTVAVEFRNAIWFNEKNIERTLRFLDRRRASRSSSSTGRRASSERAAVVAATSPDLAVVRFHGRRTETWEAKGVQTVERFRYLYDDGELDEWVAAGPRGGRAGARTRTC